MPAENAIEVEQLVREFKKGPRAVDGIDLRVEPGEIYGFLGPNGAGKSTTVLMLTTLLPPTSGRATVAGYDIVKEGPQVRAAIGAALQEAALDPFLTGREHLHLQGALHGLSRKERRRRGQELLERVGLQEAADRKVRGYSGGMKRRLDLALALVHGPRILFLDDPVPRGGRRVGRPGRDHRPGQDRRRRHSGGPEGRDRTPQRRSDAGRALGTRRRSPRPQGLRGGDPRATRRRGRQALGRGRRPRRCGACPR